MSMHKIPLSEIEEEGLKAHRLAIGTPSQLSDAFRSGVQWALNYKDNYSTEVVDKDVDLIDGQESFESYKG